MRPKDEGRLRFVALPEHRWAHCHFPRAGSWSARALAGNSYCQPNDQTAEQLAALKARGWFTSWFFRHPIRRFLSVYHLFQTPGRARSKEMRAANLDGCLFESLDTFAERALNDFPHDKHIAPQTGWGAEQCELIAPLYRADEAWAVIRRSVAAELPVAFPQVAFKRLPDEFSAAAEYEVPASVAQFYANDITYWKRVCDDFDSKQLQARRADVDGEARRQEEVVRADQPQRVRDQAVVALQG